MTMPRWPVAEAGCGTATSATLERSRLVFQVCWRQGGAVLLLAQPGPGMALDEQFCFPPFVTRYAGLESLDTDSNS